MMTRGDIHYIIDVGSSTGSEQCAGRPAIIVSNDACNAHSAVVEVVFLTTRPKSDLPTHVTIRSASKISIALCEQITSVSTARIGDYIGTCTEQEMQTVDTALRISLALDEIISKEVKPAAVDDKLVEDLRHRLSQAISERDMYRTMYKDIIENILDRGTK